MSHALQSALESGQEAKIVPIYFNATFDRVNDQGIPYRLSSVGIGGSVLSVLTQSYLIDHSLFWWVDVAVNWSTLCQECHRAVFWACCFSFCTPRNFFPFWRISLLDDSTLMAFVPSPGARVTVVTVSPGARVTHLKLLDRVVSGACFLADRVLNCDLSHRQSVAVLRML